MMIEAKTSTSTKITKSAITHLSMKDDTLAKLFFSRTHADGDGLAIRYKHFGIWRRVSWSEYYRNVKQFGLGMVSLGFQARDTINILSENRPEWLYADLAAICLRGVSIGIYPTNAPFEIEYIAGHSDCRMIVVENEEQLDKVLEVRDKLPKLEKIIVIELRNIKKLFDDAMLISFDEVMATGRKMEKEEPELFEKAIESTRPDDVCLIIYTSGTTGMPKGAMHAHDNILHAVRGVRDTWQINESHEVLSYLPLCHIAERVLSFFEALFAGYTVNFAESLDTVTENLQEISPRFVFCPPRIWEKFHSKVAYDIKDAPWFKRTSYAWALAVGYKHNEISAKNNPIPFLLNIQHWFAQKMVYRKLKNMIGLERAEIICSGAAPISHEIIQYFHAIDCVMLEAYGLTESCGIGTLQRRGRIKFGTVGEPVPNTEFKIAEDGEILIRGPGNFKGYHKDPELTAETIDEDGWLHTGDIGEFDEDGLLKITDRKKDVIITAGGKNVSPQMIEGLLKFSPYIADAVVIGDKRKYLTAMIMLDEENCSKYSIEQRIPYSTYEDLASNPEILKMIKKEIEDVNRKLAQVETIKKFSTFKKMLKEDDGELTATMKIKRKAIAQKFQKEIDKMYSAEFKDMIVI